MRDRVLALAVVVHGPDLFHAGARGDVVDLGFGDSVYAAAEPEDDLVGELVSDQSSVVLRGDFAVLLADDRGRAGFLDVEEIAVDIDACRPARRRVPSASIAALAGAADHCDKFTSAGAAGVTAGARALRNHVEDAGVRQIVIESVIEGRFENRGLRIGRIRFEVGGRHANLFDAEVGAGPYPVLGMG